MKKIVIDSGGTAFKYMILDESYSVVEKNELMLPTLTTGFDIVIDNIKKILEKYPDIDSGIFGMAGYDAISQDKNNILNSLFVNFSNYLLLTDGQLPLHFVDDENVICISLGTGTVINVRSGNNIEQYLGLGYAIGDTGSGYEIGKKILYHALAYKDQEIIDAIKDVMNLDKSIKLIEYIWSDTSKLNERIAKVTKSILSKNKKLKFLAIEKYNESMCEIIDFLKKIIRPNQTIILNGGISTHIKDTMKIMESNFPKNKIVLVDNNALDVGCKILRDKIW